MVMNEFCFRISASLDSTFCRRNVSHTTIMASVLYLWLYVILLSILNK